MTLTLLACICFAAAGTVAMMGVWRLPFRTGCPDCGARTVAVVAPRWIRWLGLPVDARWCMSCGWEGFSRRATGGGVHRPTGSDLERRRGPGPSASRNGSGGSAWRRPDQRPTGYPDRPESPPEGGHSGSLDAGEQD